MQRRGRNRWDFYEGTFTLPGTLHSIRAATFNLQALFLHIPKVRKRTTSTLLFMLKSHDIIVLQETHGTTLEMQQLANRALVSHTCSSPLVRATQVAV